MKKSLFNFITMLILILTINLIVSCSEDDALNIEYCLEIEPIYLIDEDDIEWLCIKDNRCGDYHLSYAMYTIYENTIVYDKPITDYEDIQSIDKSHVYKAFEPIVKIVPHYKYYKSIIIEVIDNQGNSKIIPKDIPPSTTKGIYDMIFIPSSEDLLYQDALPAGIVIISPDQRVSPINCRVSDYYNKEQPVSDTYYGDYILLDKYIHDDGLFNFYLTCTSDGYFLSDYYTNMQE